MTGYCVLLSQWTFFFYNLLSFRFYFHEKKQRVWVSDNLMSDGKLHFRGGASVVGPSFVTVLCSLNGSSPIGFMVRKVCTQSGGTAPDFRRRDWGKGADWYWGMWLGRLGVPIFELSTWKAIYCTSCILTGRWRQKSGILLLGIQFFFSKLCSFIEVFRIC